MKVFPEIDNCNNCNAIYEVPLDQDGLLQIDTEGSYLCQRCRTDPNLKTLDWIHEIKCMNSECSNTWYRAKRYTHDQECWNCCFKRHQENKGK